MKQAALKWLKQARHDLEMADKNIAIGGYDIAAFLSHQAVEKLLKAILIFEGRKPPRSHYLDELARILGSAEEIDDALDELAGDYMISRYPDVSSSVPYEEYDKDIATEKIIIARTIFDKLKDRYNGIEADDE